MTTLIIKTNKEPLHDLEFVQPIEKILSRAGVSFKTVHYNELKKTNLTFARRVIITGTSLQDNSFLDDVEKFKWIRDFKKPILGICSGMQIISLVFGSEIKRKEEIGFYKENFTKPFLGMVGEREVYHLHNNFVMLPYEFERFTDSKVPQAIKHRTKKIYGILFHPEVRNELLLVNFCKG